MLRVNRKSKSKLQWDKVQDSGIRNAFNTGSQRDTQEGKGRYDLIPTTVLKRLAQHYENGAIKYGDNNWQKGQPLLQYYNSAMRHLTAIHNADLDEDHFAAVIWNVACMIHHIDAMLEGSLPENLDSFGIVQAIKKFDMVETLKDFNPPYTQGTTIRVITSGTLTDFMDYSSDNDIGKVFDKDRFNNYVQPKRRTIKLDPEELG